MSKRAVLIQWQTYNTTTSLKHITVLKKKDAGGERLLALSPSTILYINGKTCSVDPMANNKDVTQHH